MLRRSQPSCLSSALVQQVAVRLLVICLVLTVWLGKGSLAQQQYNNKKGYICSNSGSTSCHTFVLYRAQSAYSTVKSVADLFNANASDVARINNFTLNQTLSTGAVVFVPVTCGCYNSLSFANVSYTIQDGDIFDNLSKITYESLTTTTAIENAYGGNPENLTIGQKVSIPIRCACPSLAQIAQGDTALVTYLVSSGDVESQIGLSFGLSTSDVIHANELKGDDNELQYGTTLLIPINSTVPVYTAAPSVPNSPQSTPPPAQFSSPQSSGKSSSNKTGVYVGVAVGLFAALGILFGGIVFALTTYRKQKIQERGNTFSEAPVTSTSTVLDSTESIVSSDRKLMSGDPLAGMFDLMGSDRPCIFTFAEIEDATNNFSEGSKVRGSVYRGILKDQVVAIKQMKGTTMSQELNILCKVHHTNLVKLVGICATESEDLYLVYEYAENGSLNDCLHTDVLSRKKLATKSSSFLSWTTRVQVALDAACGLEYIHEYTNPSYVHKDVKSSNILLDENFRAKIANFAMATSGVNATMTRHIDGTYGYMSPEYLAHGLVTTKGDVFAFGVVLLELLSGQEAILEDADGEERCLYATIAPILNGDEVITNMKKWIDPILQSNYPVELALSVASLAKACVDEDPMVRPSMKNITFTLSNMLNQSMEWETTSVFANVLLKRPIELR